MKPEKPENIVYGTLKAEDPEGSLVRMAQPLSDPVTSWENASDDEIAHLRDTAIASGTPEERLMPGFQERVITITGSDESIDRYNSRILVDGEWNGKKYGQGWKLDEYRRNPVFMPLHDYGDVPVGQSLDVYVDSVGERKRLRFIILFTSKEENPFGDTMHRLYRGGFMRASSVGWMPSDIIRCMDEDQMKEFGMADDHDMFSPVVYPTNELYELSAVPIPGNPNALIEDKFTPEEVKSFRTLAEQAIDVAPEFAGRIKEYLDTKHVEQVEVDVPEPGTEELGEGQATIVKVVNELVASNQELIKANAEMVSAVIKANTEMVDAVRDGFATLEKSMINAMTENDGVSGSQGGTGDGSNDLGCNRDQYAKVLDLADEITDKLGG